MERGSETWTYDDEQEFFADYRKAHFYSKIKKGNDVICIEILYFEFTYTIVSVNAKTRGEIESIFDIFEEHYPSSKRVPLAVIEKKLNIFIGHGQSPQWRDIKDHLADKHGYEIVAYETGARAGHKIRDILDEMTLKSSFAILVMTGEDKDENGKLRARQNVIHEIGLFQGKLGFK